MMNTAQLSLDRADEQVECMMRQGAAFAGVECAIDGARLSQDHKAALWLLAWSFREPGVQRRDARLMAARFAGNGDRTQPDTPGSGVAADAMSDTAMVLSDGSGEIVRSSSDAERWLAEHFG
jgi:hypothetical protein